MRRGNLLWTGSRMMLAEHRQLLNESLEKKEEGSEKRDWDEQQLEEWQEILNQSFYHKNRVHFILKGKKEKKRLIGYIADWSIAQGILYVQKENERIQISVEEIENLMKWD